MSDVASKTWWEEPRTEHELLRLDLVGLAAEISTVCEYVTRTLAALGDSVQADTLRMRLRGYSRLADAVLWTSESIAAWSDTQLLDGVFAYRTVQRLVCESREEAEALAGSAAKPIFSIRRWR